VKKLCKIYKILMVFIMCCGAVLIANSVFAAKPSLDHAHLFVESPIYLKSEATCTSPAVFYTSCGICGVKGTSTFTYGDNAHAYLEWQSYREGQHAKICEKCNTIIEYGTHRNTLTTNATSHIRKCRDCGMIDEGKHTYNRETGKCTSCYRVCSHDYQLGECTICMFKCKHSYNSQGLCRWCDIGASCDHSYNSYGVCKLCGARASNICKHTIWKWEKTDNKHRKICECGEKLTVAEEHQYYDTSTICSVCGYECKHIASYFYKFDEGNQIRHGLKCQKCNYQINEEIHGIYDNCKTCQDTCKNHIYKYGKCTKCGKPENCKHEKFKYEKATETHHQQVCERCFFVISEEVHTYDSEGKCSVCDGICEHVSISWEKISNKEHQKRCLICNNLVRNSEENRTIYPHQYVNQKCYCGYECEHEYSSETGICTECGDGCEHSNWEIGNNTNSHWEECSICGIKRSEKEHSVRDGRCTKTGCEYECEHNWREWEKVDENDHKRICNYNCGIEEIKEHSWVNGVCSICECQCGHSWVNGVCSICSYGCIHNYNAEGICKICWRECNHNGLDWSRGEEWHWKYCSECKVTQNQRKHTYNEDGECVECEYKCQHSNYEIKYNDNNHWEECTICKIKRSEDSHTARDGGCTKPGCGYRCKHLEYKWQKVDGTECNKVCKVCEKVLETKEHIYGTNKIIGATDHKEMCVNCNYLKVENHSYDWQMENEKQCKYACEVCGKTEEVINHLYIDGVCGECGYVCEHNGVEWSSDDEGRYKYCSECERTYEEFHSYNESGKCRICGYECKHSNADWTIYKDWHKVEPGCRNCNKFISESHDYDEESICKACGYECEHQWENEKCVECGYECEHSNYDIKYNDNNHWEECTGCGLKRSENRHSVREGECTKPGCGYKCGHSWGNWEKVDEKEHKRICNYNCGIEEIQEHDWKNGVCKKCFYSCIHTYSSEAEVCTNCGLGCEHKYIWEKIDEKQCKNVCEECGKIQEVINHLYIDGVCGECYYICDHSGTPWESANDLHWKDCNECGEPYEESHSYNEYGECGECGHICDHIGGAFYKDDESHWGECRWCEQSLNEEHTYDEEGSCRICDHVCTHSGITWDTDNEGRSGECEWCEQRLNEKHDYDEEGSCKVCGHVCTHDAIDWMQHRDGHWGTCGSCEYMINEEHAYDDKGQCSICEYQCKHLEERWEKVDKEQCRSICQICGKTKDTMNHVYLYSNGICKRCEESCEHNWGEWEKVDEKDHKRRCNYNCGIEETKEHTWEEGVCSTCEYVCGHEWEEGVCGICSYGCIHNYNAEGICKICWRECNHNGADWSRNEEWHRKYCSECNVTQNQGMHTYNGSENCIECGYKCEHSSCEIKYDTNSHWEECSICSFKRSEKEHSVRDGRCTKPGCEYECEHEDSQFPIKMTLAGDIYKCGTCGVEWTIYHDYKDGVCKECGEICTHEYDYEKLEEPYCKEGTCKYCGDVYTILEHSYKGSKVCINCGETCDHSKIEWKYDDVERWRHCEICKQGDREDHVYGEDAKCDNCGRVCEHMCIGDDENQWFKNTENHRKTCIICDTYVDEKHKFDDEGSCEVCYYECEHDEYNEERVCTKCGCLCEHESYIWQYDAANHWEECIECGNPKNSNPHDFKNGKCAKLECGYGCNHKNEWQELDNEQCMMYVCTECGTISEILDHNYFDNGICAECGETCTHSEFEWRYDDIERWRECGKCGYEEYESHEYNENGVCIRSGCGYECKHSDTPWKTDEKGRWKDCSYCGQMCTEDHEYNGDNVCDKCGYGCQHQTKRWIQRHKTGHKQKCLQCQTVTIELTGHSYGEYSAESATNHKRICRDCEYVESTPHEYEEKVSPKYVKEKATCTSLAVYYESCKYCGAKGTETFEAGDKLAHKYTESGMCECGESCPHDIKDPYQTIDYIYHAQYCRICGQEVSKEPHGYDPNTQKCVECSYQCDHFYAYCFDDEKHWDKCVKCGFDKDEGTQHTEYIDGECVECGYICTHEAGKVRYEKLNDSECKAVCEKCNEEVKTEHNYENFVCLNCKEECNHTIFNTGVSTSISVCKLKCGTCGFLSEGTHKYNTIGSCEKCTYMCEHSNWEIKYDDNNHWEECSICHFKKSENSHSVRDRRCTKPGCEYVCKHLEHEWQVANEEQCNYACEICGKVEKTEEHKYNEITGICIKCSYQCLHTGEFKWEVAGIIHSKICIKCKTEVERGIHSFSEEKNIPEYLADNATCERPALYYYSCETCGAEGTETFEAGDKLEHNYTIKYDNTSHWEECNECNTQRSKSEHSVIDGKCTKPGCGYEWEKCEHVLVGTKYDHESHWKVCSLCDEKIDEADHSFVWKTKDSIYCEKECICGKIEITERHSWENGSCKNCGFSLPNYQGTIELWEDKETEEEMLIKNKSAMKMEAGKELTLEYIPRENFSKIKYQITVLEDIEETLEPVEIYVKDETGKYKELKIKLPEEEIKIRLEIVGILINGKETEKREYAFNLVKKDVEVLIAPISKNKVMENVTDWAALGVMNAEEQKLIPDRLYNSDSSTNITRAEFAAIAVKVYEAALNPEILLNEENPFEDTTDEDVLKAYQLGIVSGMTETEFRPDSNINREQMATMMLNTIKKLGMKEDIDLDQVEKFKDHNEIYDWALESVYYMKATGIMKGVLDNRFESKQNATREQAIVVASNCYKYLMGL